MTRLTTLIALLACASLPALAGDDAKAPAKAPAEAKASSTDSKLPKHLRRDLVLDLKTDPQSTLQVGAFLKVIADATKRSLIHGPMARGTIRLTLKPGGKVTLSEAYGFLAQAGVRVIETESTLYAYHERSLTTSALPAPLLIQDGQPLPELIRPVRAVFRINNGAGSAIFANLRGLMARDRTRYGNILYIQGPELILIHDLSPQVAAYRDLIRLLDARGPKGPGKTELSLDVFEVPTATWATLRTKSAAEVHAALSKSVAAGTTKRLEQARLSAAVTPGSLRGRGSVGDFSLVRSTRSGTTSRHVSISRADQKLRLELQTLAEGGGEETLTVECVVPANLGGRVFATSLRSGSAPTQAVFVFRSIGG